MTLTPGIVVRACVLLFFFGMATRSGFDLLTAVDGEASKMLLAICLLWTLAGLIWAASLVLYYIDAKRDGDPDVDC